MAVFSWNARTEKDKKFIADQRKDISKDSIAKERKSLRDRGLPVPVNKNKFETSAGGDVLRSILNPVATILARPGQALAAANGFSEEDQTLKTGYFGDIKTSKNSKDVLKDVGRGAQTIALGLGLTGAAEGLGGKLLTGTLEGAAGGYMQGLGVGLENEEKGKKLLGTTAKNTGIGALFGLATGGLGAAFSWAKKAKTATGGVASKVEEVAANGARDIPPPNPPSAPVRRGTQPNKFNQEPGNYDTPKGNVYTPDSQLPVIQAGTVPKSSEPSIQIGEQSPSAKRGEFTYSPISDQKKVTLPKLVSENVENKGSKGTTTPKGSNLPQDKTLTPGGVEVPKVQLSEPVKAKQKAVLNDAPPEEFKSKSKQYQIDFYNEDPERALRIVEGKEKIPEGISKDAMYRLAANDATGETAIRLAENPIASISGQSLGMQNIGDRTNSLVDSIKSVLETRKAKLNPKEQKASFEELKNIIREHAPTKQEFEALIKEIEC